MIDWPAFTPVTALNGGLLIGLAASALIVLNGQVLGVSGTIARLLSAASDWRSALSLLVGMGLAPLLLQRVQALPSSDPASHTTPSGLLIVAGLLVGFGSRLGSGCASGHGICGLARFSLRSLVATLSFMAAGFITVTLMRLGA